MPSQPALSKSISRAVTGAAFALAGMVMVAGTASAAPEAELWDRWTAHDPASTVTVDHSAWDALTRKHISGGGATVALVDYQGIAGERAKLDGYLQKLSQVPVSDLDRSEQFAYWANLYNALTVQVILDHYPARSIRDIDISPGFFSDGPWGATLFTVEGTELTLDDIEHRILRPIWKDPRIHYAVNCASIGCPDLHKGAFTADKLDAQLDQAARAFVNHPRGAQVQRRKLYVSSIYEWFKEDFGDSDAGVIAHLKNYAEPRLANELQRVNRIADDDYDWSINDTARPRPTANSFARRNNFSGGGRGGGS
ncbi:MAG: DUF547 domain-containing protein [Pseudomonadota bacterium]